MGQANIHDKPDFTSINLIRDHVRSTVHVLLLLCGGVGLCSSRHLSVEGEKSDSGGGDRRRGGRGGGRLGHGWTADGLVGGVARGPRTVW
jgi:hypothetical protein